MPQIIRPQFLQCYRGLRGGGRTAYVLSIGKTKSLLAVFTLVNDVIRDPTNHTHA